MRNLQFDLLGAALVLTSVFLLFPQNASAHPFAYGAVETSLSIQGSTITLRTEAPQNLSSSGTDAFFADYFENRITIRANGQPCAFTLHSADADGAIDHSTFDGSFACPTDIANIDDLEIRSSLLLDYFTTLDHFVTVTHRGRQWELLFTQDRSVYPAEVASRRLGTPLAHFFAVAGHFLWLGMLHIWSGFDHVLFLVAAILAVRSPKGIILTVTSFTIAHSITLLAAGFGLVTLPSALVEPAIALSIAYAAIRAIMFFRSDAAPAQAKGRWMTTFFFGLIHGLGFAAVLSETRIPDQFFAPALIMFNIGVEIGQFAILAIVVPILWRIDRIRNSRSIFIGISSLILSLALFWFFQRLV